jgi:hypothetical protein
LTNFVGAFQSLLYKILEGGNVWMFDDQFLPIGVGGSNAEAKRGINLESDSHCFYLNAAKTAFAVGRSSTSGRFLRG